MLYNTYLAGFLSLMALKGFRIRLSLAQVEDSSAVLSPQQSQNLRTIGAADDA
jgi:hypothetical protein